MCKILQTRNTFQRPIPDYHQAEPQSPEQSYILSQMLKYLATPKDIVVGSRVGLNFRVSTQSGPHDDQSSTPGSADIRDPNSALKFLRITHAIYPKYDGPTHRNMRSLK